MSKRIHNTYNEIATLINLDSPAVPKIFDEFVQ